MTILQAVAAGLENTEKRKEPKKKSDRYFLDGKVADRELKACNICRIVWQKHVFNGKTTIKYYDEVPRYGKEKHTCPSCCSYGSRKMNVLVVNGSGSIGSALVSELFNEGLNVFYTSSNGSHSNHGEGIHWRYSGEESVRELFEKLKSKFNHLDAVVNCMG